MTRDRSERGVETSLDELKLFVLSGLEAQQAGTLREWYADQLGEVAILSMFDLPFWAEDLYKIMQEDREPHEYVIGLLYWLLEEDFTEELHREFDWRDAQHHSDSMQWFSVYGDCEMKLIVLGTIYWLRGKELPE